MEKDRSLQGKWIGKTEAISLKQHQNTEDVNGLI
jgi:hypothetical protein